MPSVCQMGIGDSEEEHSFSALDGFPIGGVAAFDPKQGGVISPGGIGFDILVKMILNKVTKLRYALDGYQSYYQ